MTKQIDPRTSKLKRELRLKFSSLLSEFASDKITKQIFYSRLLMLMKNGIDAIYAI